MERYRDEIRKNIPEVDAVVGTGELESILTAAGFAPPAATAPQLVNITLDFAGNPAPRACGRSGLPRRGRSARAAGPLRARCMGRRVSGAANLSLRRDDAPPARDRQDLRISQDRRGLRPSLFLLRDPEPARQVPLAPLRVGRREAEQLVARGVREITLIGQDTTCYGEDFGLKDGLAALLDRLAQIEGLRWLRFLYAYPNKITGRLLDTIAKHDRIVKYMDVPLQHAAAPVLKRMRRGANAEIFLKTLEKVRAAVPGIVLRTSFIVGFPGETAEDHAALMDFVRDAKFDWMGAFAYSDEEGSHAYAFEKSLKVPKRTIEARRRALMKLQQSISRERKRQWIGRTMDILVEGESEETPLLWEGRSQFHAPEIDGKVYINDFGPHETLVPGTFYRAEIMEAHDYDVVARVIE